VASGERFAVRASHLDELDGRVELDPGQDPSGRDRARLAQDRPAPADNGLYVSLALKFTQ
jgi:hypothetical protein